MGFCFSKPSSGSPAHSHYRQLPKRNQHAPHPNPRSAPSSSPSSSSQPQVGPVLGKPYFDIRTLYTLDKELGRGQFGITYLCTEKLTGLKYACKSISRRKLTSRKGIDDVKKEIMILQHLTGQPNIVEFKGAYEDWHHVHLVMELCAGGELFDRIIARGLYSEDEAAVIFRQVVNVVHVCHFMGVIHRDLKPENFLLATKDPNSPLKAMDFGLSVFIDPGLFLHAFSQFLPFLLLPLFPIFVPKIFSSVFILIFFHSVKEF